jgi:Resolvase, N terminal domain
LSGIISYLRVSTVRQGRSGLGLEVQREAVARFAAAEGREVLAEFVEVETGKGSDALDRRPKLAEALAKAKNLRPVRSLNLAAAVTRRLASCAIAPAAPSPAGARGCSHRFGQWRIECDNPAHHAHFDCK